MAGSKATAFDPGTNLRQLLDWAELVPKERREKHSILTAVQERCGRPGGRWHIGIGLHQVAEKAILKRRPAAELVSGTKNMP